MENKNIMKSIENMLKGLGDKPKKISSVTIVFKDSEGNEKEEPLEDDEDEEMDEKKK